PAGPGAAAVGGGVEAGGVHQRRDRGEAGVCRADGRAEAPAHPPPLGPGGGAVSESSSTGGETLAPTKARLVDQVCDRFEAAWQAGQPPRIEDYLPEVPEPEHPDLLRELLVLELAYRRRSGERPTPADYRSRFPAHRTLIDTVFTASPASQTGPSAP